MDVSQIYDGLWQGAHPPIGTLVKDSGFSLLILCAREYQPPANNFPGIEVFYAPNKDNFIIPPSRETLNSALQAANKAVEFLQRKKQVLVTCWAGINRSGLVSAIILHKLLNVSGITACSIIERQRTVITNPQFLKCLSAIIPEPKSHKEFEYESRP